MLEPSIDLASFFQIIVPGAITVWSFRHLTKSKKQGDFEYLALSVFWGTVILLLQTLIVSPAKLEELLGNMFSTTIVMSLFGYFIGWIGSIVKNNIK